MDKIGSLTVQFDTQVPAVYVYLRPPEGFRSHRSKRIADGLVVDLDAEGKLIGVEMMGPGSVELLFKRVIPRYHASVLRQLAPKRRILEELLSSRPA